MALSPPLAAAAWLLRRHEYLVEHDDGYFYIPSGGVCVAPGIINAMAKHMLVTLTKTDRWQVARLTSTGERAA